MDENNFVGQAPGGGYVVYAKGKEVGSYADRGEAERAFNTATGQSNEPARSTAPRMTVGAPSVGGAPLSMVGGLDQIAAQQGLLNQEYLRQRLKELEIPTAMSTLSGFLPKTWRMAQQGGTTAATRYKTKNGQKTLQQMRDEIVAASKA